MRLPLLLLAMGATAGCVTQAERQGQGQQPRPRIDQVFPDKVMAGEGFNVQSDGTYAISVAGNHFGPGAKIMINGNPLDTPPQTSATNLACVAPARYFERPGAYAISVELPDGRKSNALPLVVMPRTGPAPVIGKLYPEGAKAGVHFNVQPGDLSALGITGENFLPKITILANGEPLDSNFTDVDQCAGILPAKFYAQPGVVRITVRNRDGKESAAKEFTVTP